MFLDRDGTVIEDTGYLHDPNGVRLLPGAARAITRLNRAGLRVVTVTNQSGIARGLYPESDYHAVQRRLIDLLATAGARLDGQYFCPHYPAMSGPCDCRKPGVRLFTDAARDLHLDLARSAYVGDRPSDLEPGRHFGGRPILVRTGEGAQHEAQARTLGAAIVADLAAAADLILGGGDRDG